VTEDEVRSNLLDAELALLWFESFVDDMRRQVEGLRRSAAALGIKLEGSS
jgi:hypothetical protein